MTTNLLLKQIDEYLAVRGISPYRFGLLAARNGRLVERLRSGKTTITLKTLEQVERYLAENSPPKEDAA